MNVLYFSSVYPGPDSNTHGIYSFHLMKALAITGQVGVIAPRSWLTHVSRALRVVEDVPSLGQEWAEFVRYPTWFYPPRAGRSCHGALMWWSSRRVLRECVDRWRPDCVLSYWAHPDGAAAVRAARALNVPAVVMVGGSDVLLLTRHPAARRRIMFVLNRADAVVAVSKDIRDRLLSLGLGMDKIHVVYRGVDLERYSPGDRDLCRQRLGLRTDVPIVLWVGRMVAVKGLEVLLEALERIKSRGSDVLTILVGRGPLEKRLRAQVTARGLTTNVHFAGAVAHGDLPNWYRAADVTVLPSHSEGIPNVLLESISCGTPFVASRVGGIPEIATEPIDRLVSPGNPVELADAIELALPGHPVGVERGFRPTGWTHSAAMMLNVMRPLTDWRSSG